MSSGLKTNNDENWLRCKQDLRDRFSKEGQRVLECYAGNHVLWSEIKKRKKLKILSIDKEDYKKVNLKGDNLKWLASLDLSNFDIIDLDAYGFPVKQIDAIVKKGWHGGLFITCIQSILGQLPHAMLVEYGYSKEMIAKCPTLFNKNAFDKLKNYLARKGINKIYYYGNTTKKYLYCEV